MSLARCIQKEPKKTPIAPYIQLKKKETQSSKNAYMYLARGGYVGAGGGGGGA